MDSRARLHCELTGFQRQRCPVGGRTVAERDGPFRPLEDASAVGPLPGHTLYLALATTMLWYRFGVVTRRSTAPLRPWADGSQSVNVVIAHPTGLPVEEPWYLISNRAPDLDRVELREALVL